MFLTILVLLQKLTACHQEYVPADRDGYQPDRNEPTAEELAAYQELVELYGPEITDGLLSGAIGFSFEGVDNSTIQMGGEMNQPRGVTVTIKPGPNGITVADDAERTVTVTSVTQPNW